MPIPVPFYILTIHLCALWERTVLRLPWSWGADTPPEALGQDREVKFSGLISWAIFTDVGGETMNTTQICTSSELEACFTGIAENKPWGNNHEINTLLGNQPDLLLIVCENSKQNQGDNNGVLPPSLPGTHWGRNMTLHVHVCCPLHRNGGKSPTQSQACVLCDSLRLL